jgi:hypothetical protein
VSRAYNPGVCIRAPQATNHVPSPVRPTRPVSLTAEETPPRGPIEVTPSSPYQEVPTAPTKLPVEEPTTLLLPGQDSGSTALKPFESQALRRRPDAVRRATAVIPQGNIPSQPMLTLGAPCTSWEKTRATLIAMGVPHHELGRFHSLYLWGTSNRVSKMDGIRRKRSRNISLRSLSNLALGSSGVLPLCRQARCAVGKG